MLDNTLIAFTSDNGANRMKIDAPALFNRPRRGVKGEQYEGELRAPANFRWPEHVPAGTQTAAALHFVDLYPTLRDLAGATPPQWHALDGVSVAPVVRGAADAGPQRGQFWFFPKYAGYHAKTRRWRNTVLWDNTKLTELVESGRLELYDLQADPGNATPSRSGARTCSRRCGPG